MGRIKGAPRIRAYTAAVWPGVRPRRGEGGDAFNWEELVEFQLNVVEDPVNEQPVRRGAIV
jgi:hypothetical protein